MSYYMIKMAVNKAQQVCLECGGQIIYDHERGERLCCECGLVMSDREVDPDRVVIHNLRSNYDEVVTHYGPPIIDQLSSLKLIEVINWRKVSNPRLRESLRWQGRFTYQARRLIRVNRILKRLQVSLEESGLIRREALNYFKSIGKIENLDLRGRSILSLAISCYYLALNKYKRPYRLKDLCDIFNHEVTSVRKTLHLLLKKGDFSYYPLSLFEWVPRFISELNLDYSIERDVNTLIDLYLRNRSLRGYSPLGIIGAAIYIACKSSNQSITQDNLSHTLGVTAITIRSRVKEINKLIIKEKNYDFVIST